MMRPSLNRHTLAALVALATFAAMLAPSRARAEEYWLDGYEVEVTLRPERESFLLGEPVTLMLTFRGRSDAALELLLSGDRGGEQWPDDFEVTVTDPDGKTLPRPEGDRGAEIYTNVAMRASSHSQPTMNIVVSLANWAELKKPGVYTVTCRRGVTAGPYNGLRYRIFPGTTRPAVEISVRAQVKIVSGGEEGVGRLVEELGAKTLACDRDPSDSAAAAVRLAKMDDERIIGPFAAAVSKCKNASVKYTALGALAKFQTDAAFEALRAAASDADEDFRTVVAQAVARNKHPKAPALLLSMRRDSFYGVRLIVLYAMEAKDTEAARRVIWEMTNDEHPSVRDEALRFLQQRPE